MPMAAGMDDTSIREAVGALNRHTLPQHMQGWQCPSCKVIWSPHVRSCQCNSPKVSSTLAGST